jgi:2,4-dienoyl-CoA reductase-like NADH-dependent reductase (Old Yellow Enzyme family)
MTFEKPRPATQDDTNLITECFALAAEFLYNAGFDGIQLHGAHGYLLAQFLSSTTNRRTDAYGGSLQNRMRLILEIAEAVHKRVPSSFILGIKINSVEFQDGGFTPDEARQLCRALEDSRFDYVELSGGTYEELAFAHRRESTKRRESFFLDFAREIVPGLTRTRSYVTGGFKTLGAMVKALDTVDGVGLARPVCQEFHLAADLLEGKVNGAIKQGLDTQDFGLTYLASGSQICMVGKDKEPIDLSRKEDVNRFMKDLEAWRKKMEEDKEAKEYGYPDVSGDTRPYGGDTRTCL